MSKKDYEYYQKEGVISKLPESEKERYIYFLEQASKDDLKAVSHNLTACPRWSIIAGYYFMHDLTKLFLAKRYNLKISGKEVHEATIQALKEACKEEYLRAKIREIIQRLEEVEERYNILMYLITAKEKRGKLQYYNPGEKREFEKIAMDALNFKRDFVETFDNVINELIK